MPSFPIHADNKWKSLIQQQEEEEMENALTRVIRFHN
jgi:hypothetical protein